MRGKAAFDKRSNKNGDRDRDGDGDGSSQTVFDRGSDTADGAHRAPIQARSESPESFLHDIPPKRAPRRKHAGQAWFDAQGWQPFAFQKTVWQHVARGDSGLLHASTGAGKTYAVWLGALGAFDKTRTASSAAPIGGVQPLPDSANRNASADAATGRLWLWAT